MSRKTFDFATDAHKAMLAFSDGTIDDLTLQDLLTGLMHWCDHNGVNFLNTVEAAQENYEDNKATENGNGK